MKPFLVLSLIIHSIVFVALIISSNANSRDNKYPEVYRVNLVSASSPPPPPPRTTVAQLQSTPQKQVVKSVPKPKGLTIQEETKKKIKTKPVKQIKGKSNSNGKTTKPAPPQDNYPEFLDDIDFGMEFSGIKIDGANFQSSYYINLIFAKIRSRWLNPVRLSNVIETTVFFRVESNGRIGNAQIESPSGIDAFDQSALRAILTSDPLPPLPQEFTGDHIGIHLKFEFTP